MKRGLGVVAAVALASFLIRQANTAPEVQLGGTPDGGRTLSLAADAPVRGWTRRAVPRLTVTCNRGVAQVALLTGVPIEVETGELRTVSIQVDDRQAELQQWHVSPDRQRLTASSDSGRALIESLRRGRALTVGFIPLRAEPVAARFSIGRLAEHLPTALGACT